ncbi:MAG: SLC13 family permease [Candidatus Hodarchaeota archaeon]
MIISGLIITGCFIGVVLLIMLEKLNRAIAAMIGALITYFTLIFIEHAEYSVIIDFLFGSSAEGFVNLHSLILIMGMMFIVQICHDAGVFQFIAVYVIKLAGGKPVKLLLTMCGLTVLLSAILNNILTVIILIPLTIIISRILNMNPTPYILTQAVLVNIGGTMFPISSIPNILITSSQNISFGEFFVNVGLISLIIFVITLFFFFLVYGNKLESAEKENQVLQEFNMWNYVQSKPLFYKSVVTLISVLTLLVVVPASIIPPDAIALSGAMILLVISKMKKPEEIISKINLELFLYLLGIFVISGGMEHVKIIELIGQGLGALSGGDVYLTLITILWFSGFLSATIDNIPITKVLIPVVNVINQGFNFTDSRFSYYCLAIGANWGDNLTPMGDNILVMNIAEQNNRPLRFKDFLILGFVTTSIQLFAVTIYISLIYKTIVGLVMIVGTALVIFAFYFYKRIKKKEIKQKNLRLERIKSRLKKITFRREKKNGS